MCPEVLLAEFHEDLLVSLIGSDDGLEVKDKVGIIGEDAIA